MKDGVTPPSALNFVKVIVATSYNVEKRIQCQAKTTIRSGSKSPFGQKLSSWEGIIVVSNCKIENIV